MLSHEDARVNVLDVILISTTIEIAALPRSRVRMPRRSMDAARRGGAEALELIAKLRNNWSIYRCTRLGTNLHA